MRWVQTVYYRKDDNSRDIIRMVPREWVRFMLRVQVSYRITAVTQRSRGNGRCENITFEVTLAFPRKLMLSALCKFSDNSKHFSSPESITRVMTPRLAIDPFSSYTFPTPSSRHSLFLAVAPSCDRMCQPLSPLAPICTRCFLFPRYLRSQLGSERTVLQDLH